MNRRTGLAAALAATAATGVTAAEADAAVTSNFDTGTNELLIQGDGANDVIVVACSGNSVKVNGADPQVDGGAQSPVPCGDLNFLNVEGGAGNNSIDLSATGAIQGFDEELTPSVSAGNGNDTMLGGLLKDNFITADGTNFVSGGPNADTLSGGFGSDTLDGGQGHDSVGGSAGNDLLLGGSGDDNIGGSGGDDTLSGSTGVDTLQGNGDINTLREEADADLTFTGTRMFGLADGLNDTIGGIERAELTGGPSANVLDASAFNDGPVTLTGGGGPDTLLGTGAADTFFARDGVTDSVGCSDGSDVVEGDLADLFSACESVSVPPALPPPEPPAPGPNLPDTAGPDVTIGSSITVSGSTASVRVTCPPGEPGPCRVTLSLQTAGTVTVAGATPPADAAQRRRRKRRLNLGTGSATIQPGRTGTVRVRISRANLRTLTKLKRVRVRVRLTARDQASNAKAVTKTVTLRVRAKRKRRT